MPETRLPIITLTTDFGTSDHYVAAMKAAMLSVSTQIAIVDVTHDIPPHDVMSAGWVLRNAYGAFPKWTVHVAVVDPGVGTARRPILAVTDNHYFVGPDNGIFSFVFESDPAVRVIELTSAHYFRPTISPTFHARDIFGPVAVHLARGIEASNFGEPIDNLTKLEVPRPKVTPEGAIRATVVAVDRFGNVALNVTRSSMETLVQRMKASGFMATVGAAKVTQTFSTYGEAPAGAPFLLYNSSNFLEIAANKARACELVGAKPGDIVELSLIQQIAQ